MKKLLLAAALIAGTSAIASAADMPLKAPALAPPPAWAGFYAGLNVGYGWGDTTNVVSPNDTSTLLLFPGGGVGSTALGPTNLGGEGFTAGLQAGYNWVWAPRFVFGVEADIQYSSISDSARSTHLVIGTLPATLTEREDLRAFGTVRARLGYLVTDSLLIYATGGFAYGELRQNAAYASSGLGFIVAGGNAPFSCTTASTPNCLIGGRSEWNTGWTVGGGGEWMLARNLSLKAEYLYMNLGSRGAYNILAIAPFTAAVASMTIRGDDMEYHFVRAGLNWHF